MRRALFSIFCLFLQTLFAASPALTLTNEQLPSPAPVGARHPEFSTTKSGCIRLSWQDAAVVGPARISRVCFAPESKKWVPSSETIPSISARSADETNSEVTVRTAGRQAKARFASKPPTILYSFSPDAGAHFLLPQQIDDSHPVGMPDLVLLSDGTAFALWPERSSGAEETSLWLRRISPGGSLSVPVLLGTSSTQQPDGRIALLNESENGAAKLLVAYEYGSNEASQLIVRLISVDPAESTPRHSPCNCPDDDVAAAGYPIRGRILSLLPEKNTVTLAHDGIPEVLAAGATGFTVDASFFSQAKVGNEVIGRAYSHEKVWWLLTPHLLVRPQK